MVRTRSIWLVCAALGALLSLIAVASASATLVAGEKALPGPRHAWTWQNPLPRGNALGTVAAVGDRIVTAGETQAVYSSSDGGATWRAFDLDTNQTVPAVVLDASEGSSEGWLVYGTPALSCLDTPARTVLHVSLVFPGKSRTRAHVPSPPASDDLSEGEVDPHSPARRQAMSGVASGYTLVLADEAHDGTPRADYIVTDGGVLFATADHGATWRCYGLIDPELFLLDLGFVEAWELLEADAAPAAARRFLAG